MFEAANIIDALAAERDAARQERDQALLREAALLANNEAERKTLVAHNARHATEAAALRGEVARLRGEVARLREALGSLSDHFQHGHLWSGETRGDTITNVERFARAALTSKGGEG